jgi:hypothetical protein
MHLPLPIGDAWRDVDNAARVWDELRARGRELDFALDAQGAAVITLRDLDGRFLRDVPAAKALDIACTRTAAAFDRLLQS